MPSTPSPLLRIQLMATGDQAGQWGDTTNTNLGTLLEGAIAGLASVSVTSANQALSVVDYVADQSRMAILSLSTTTTADFNVYAPPNVTKTYVIQNTSAYTATIYNSTTVGGTTAAGSGVSVPAGGVAYVFSNGTNCFSLNSVFGNFNIVGSARRITGDFSNATIASRVIFQTSTTNGQTSISAIPNGTGSDSNFAVWNNPDTANGSVGAFGASSSEVSVSSLKTGTGTYLPLIFYTGGSERMRIDASGNVGIGTSSPGSKLEVNQGILTINATDQSLTRLQLKTTGTGGRTYELVGGLPGVNNSQLSFYDATASATRMTIDASGNVGIGTSSPDAVLTLNRPSLASDIRFKVNDVLYGTIYASASDVTLNAVTSIPLTFGTNNTERMRITSAGNVGIGTTNPQTKLHVDNGATDEVARFEGTGSPFISLYDSGTREFFIQTAAEINIWGQANKAMSFATNNIVRTQIAANGSQSSVIPNGSTLYPQFACRAWINFDGTSGSIGTGRGSGNVSGVTDNGAGNYTINFTTAMPDANYAVTGTANGRNSHPARVVGAGYSGDTFSTSAVQIRTGTAGGSGANGTTEDCEYVFVAIFR